MLAEGAGGNGRTELSSGVAAKASVVRPQIAARNAWMVFMALGFT
jgi:hypothetical protein